MFEQPTQVDDVDLAFHASVSHLMPKYEDIPQEFKRGPNKYIVFQREWFYTGLKVMPKAKEGIDIDMAMRHLATIQGSFEPKHEHKEAAVAFLASLWLEL